jgi:hypothetical protein
MGITMRLLNSMLEGCGNNDGVWSDRA